MSIGDDAQLREHGLIKAIAASADLTNPDNCAFVTKQAVDLTGFAGGQWHFRYSRTAVDINSDGHRDFAVMTIANGGNSSNIPVSIVYGNGDGTFQPASPGLFSHNTGSCGASPSNMILFGDFDGDNLGDIVTGMDDDGDAGSAWFYPGDPNQSPYNTDLSQCVEAFDVNPGAESGAENFGVSTSAYTFDVNFDGVLDVLVGYRNAQPWTGGSQTDVWFGNGDGTFSFETKIREPRMRGPLILPCRAAFVSLSAVNEAHLFAQKTADISVEIRRLWRIYRPLWPEKRLG